MFILAEEKPRSHEEFTKILQAKAGPSLIPRQLAIGAGPQMSNNTIVSSDPMTGAPHVITSVMPLPMPSHDNERATTVSGVGSASQMHDHGVLEFYGLTNLKEQNSIQEIPLRSLIAMSLLARQQGLPKELSCPWSISQLEGSNRFRNGIFCT